MSILFVFSINSFATTPDISASTTTVSCSDSAINTNNAPANLEINWEPNTINLHWYADSESTTELTVPSTSQTCVYDSTLTPPPVSSVPQRTGYTFAGWKVRGLPDGYTRLQYIQTDGNSWIDTNVTPTATTLRFDYKMQLLENAYVSLFGSVADPQPRYGFRIFYQPSMNKTSFYLQSVGNYGQNITWNEVLQGNVVIRNGVSIVSMVNGNTQTINASNINLTNPGTIFIGTTHLGAASVSGKAPIKIWSFKITKNNVIVFNGIPAKDTNNVVGMYDTVTKTFFTNAGTGSFIAGPNTW